MTKSQQFEFLFISTNIAHCFEIVVVLITKVILYGCLLKSLTYYISQQNPEYCGFFFFKR